MLPKIYIGEVKKDVSYIPLLYPNLGPVDKPDWLFLNQSLHVSKGKICEIVTDPAEADFFVLPHEYFKVYKDIEYIAKQTLVAQNHNKKIIVFDYFDYDEVIDLPNSIVCRVSQYKFKKQDNEIIIPPIIEDLGGRYNPNVREKKNEPVVGFCGWITYSSVISWLAALIKGRGVKRKGLYFRKKAVNILSKSNKVITNFISRRSYSGHKLTIGLDPIVARKEYVNNMKESDYVLCVKGDGNYSLRFFEALSMGRIPLFVDTDCCLPLESEGVIDYKKFIVRIDYKDINGIADKLFDFHKSLSDAEFRNMQKMAREVYQNYLKHEVFTKLLFEQIIPNRL